MNFGDLSLERYRQIHPDFDQYLRRHHPDNYQEFIQLLYDDIRDAIIALEKTGDQRKADSEDRITLDLCTLLDQLAAYLVSHDQYAGGHVDITVRHGQRKFTWLAEAKIFASIADMREGFLQLLTRYKSPPPENCGGLIGYIRNGDAQGRMEAWKEEMSKLSLTNLKFHPCTRRNGLYFYSESKHDSWGQDFEVWHTCVVLHSDPNDKSARMRKAKRKT